MQIKNDIVWRFAVIYLMALLFGVLIIAKMFYLQFAEKDKWIQNDHAITQMDRIIEPIRGDICSDDDRILATSLPKYEIRMDFKSDGLTNEIFTQHVDTLAQTFARLFKNKTTEQYRTEFEQARDDGERYHLLKKDVSYGELKKLKQLDFFTLNRYKSGLIIIQHNNREKPYKLLASRTIGRIEKGVENEVEIGIEGAFDFELRGKNGIRLMRKLGPNFWVPMNEGNQIEPERGKDIISTINIDFQEIVEDALLNQLKKHKAEKGTAVLMETKTGQIKAIANLVRQEDGEYNETYNHAVGTSSEPGSTFKLASLIVALEDGYIDLDDRIRTGNGVAKYYGFTIRDDKRGGYGTLTVQGVFEHSSNVGVSKIITKYYYNNEEKFVDRLYSMNLNQPLGLNIQGEGKPYIKYPGDEQWWKVTLPQMSIGYEVKLTPLQILTFYNAVANNGKMVKPGFVKAIRQYGKITKEFDTEIINPSICSKATIKKVKKMLEGVVLRGTAKRLRNDKYKIAGKTGTAKLYDKDEGSYVYKYNASFVGYFPADNPRYSCIVVIYNPTQGGYYGAIAAAPVFKQIADKVYIYDLNIHKPVNCQNSKMAYLPYSKDGNKDELNTVLNHLGMETKPTMNIQSDWVVTARGKDDIKIGNRRVDDNTVPKVVGMGAKDAVFILEQIGLNVIVKGRGTVQKQSVAPGKKCKKGDKIILELS